MKRMSIKTMAGLVLLSALLFCICPRAEANQHGLFGDRKKNVYVASRRRVRTHNKKFGKHNRGYTSYRKIDEVTGVVVIEIRDENGRVVSRSRCQLDS